MQHLPLENIRVLEVGGYISLPYATSLLASLGADVVKVEKPNGGDDFRRGLNDQSRYFVQYNAGKRSLAVDLKQPEGVALVKALIPRFDVLIENMRPGKLAATGLGYADCLALRPDLVYCSVSGFGEGGPLAQRPAYDTIGQAYGGLYTLLSDDGEAGLSGGIFGDLATGLSAAAGVLAALVGRGATGAGQHMETSIMESVSAITIDAMTQYFETRRDPSRQTRHPQAQNFCLKTASGESIAVHLSSSQKFWFQFCQAIEREDLADDPRFLTYHLRDKHYFELAEIAEKEFLKRPMREWEARLLAADVPNAPVLSMSGVAAHEQTKWLDLMEPERNGLSLVRPPWRFD
jgi:crotonobetainyl-CoA:carnitine CoA-transferase CaiB-like acyl-CoA transferase